MLYQDVSWSQSPFLFLTLSFAPHLPLPPPPPPPIPHSPIIDHCGPDSSGIRELLRSKPGRGAQETPPPLSTTLTTQTEREVISLYAPHYSPSFFTSPSPSFSLQETQVTSDCSGGSEKTQRRYKLVNVRVIEENIGRLFHPFLPLRFLFLLLLLQQWNSVWQWAERTFSA